MKYPAPNPKGFDSPSSPHRRRFLRDASTLVLGVLALPGAARTELAHMRNAAMTGDASMRTRPIPATGEQVPVIGMGTWQTFDPSSLSPDALTPLTEVMRVFFDAGGRVVDSSPMYGKSESVTGLLSTRLGINDRLFIATKVWTSGKEAGIRQMERSLAELRREGIELMQIHNLVDWRTHIGTLRDWKEAGRIRYIGITHHQMSAFDELEQIIRRDRPDFVQLPYSIAARDAERRLLPTAAEMGTAVLVNRPFEGGDLFGTVRDRPLPELVRRFSSSWSEAFLKFIIAHPAVTSVIPATSKPHHMRDNVRAGTGPLPDASEREKLAALMRRLT